MTTTHTQATRVEAGQLRGFVERKERLKSEVKDIADTVKELDAEIKGAGYEPRLVNQVLAIRAKDPADRSEEEAKLSMYLDALGMGGN
tara:strand:- start:8498 stop:8761 length:264 start_codon:yes stop_codon:yes gene_type:complete